VNLRETTHRPATYNLVQPVAVYVDEFASADGKIKHAVRNEALTNIVAGKSETILGIVVIRIGVRSGIARQFAARFFVVDEFRVRVIDLILEAMAEPFLQTHVSTVVPRLANIRIELLHVAELRKRAQDLRLWIAGRAGSQQSQIARRDLINAFGKRAWQMMTEGSGIANVHQEVAFELMLNIGMNLIQVTGKAMRLDELWRDVGGLTNGNGAIRRRELRQRWIAG